jgi:membrane protein
VISLARAVWARMKQDNVSLLAAAIAFWGMLALVPGLVALVSLYGLVADPAQVEQQMRDNTEALPDEARELIVHQLQSVASSPRAGLGAGLLIGLAVALWAASAGMRTLLIAIGVVYGDRPGERGFVAERGLSLLLTLAAIAFLGVAILMIAVVPAWLADTGLGGAERALVWLLRWPALGGALIVGIGALYRVGPHGRPATRLFSPGALVAAGLWITASFAFSIYAARINDYNEAYGSLGAVVVLLVWLQLTALSVLVGAEVNMAVRCDRVGRGGFEPP